MNGIAAAGGAPDAVRIIEGDFTFRSGLAAARALLADRGDITAVYASNDDMAAGVYAAAAERGVRIPDDISVAGYDDNAVAELVWPPLTTIRQPVSEMAAEAARMLIDERAGSPIKSIEMPYELVIRQSTARPDEIAT